MSELHLEPRVARLETGLETLTKNVSDMSISVKENSIVINNKIDNLVVSVTKAQAPKSTDWSLMISLGFLIIAIASAAFWPLHQESTNNKIMIDKVASDMVIRDSASETRLMQNNQLVQDLVNAKIMAIDSRFNHIEKYMIYQDQSDFNELRKWRLGELKNTIIISG